MTQQDDITQRVLTDAEIQALWDEACKDSPQAPGWNRHIRFARALLSRLRAPVADTLPLEAALHVLVDKIVPGLDTGDLVHDAGRASAMLSGIMASAPVAPEPFRAAFANGVLPATRFHELWESAAPSKNSGHTMLEDLTWQVGKFAALVAAEVRAPVAVPPGWKLVPVEPTPEMEDAGCDVPCPQDDAPAPATVYAAMIGAAPPAPVASAPVADERGLQAWADRFPEISDMGRLRDAWNEARASAPVAGADRDADERAVMTPAKAAYVEHFGHAAGWLSYKGSWFIEGFKAGQKSAPVAGEALTAEAVERQYRDGVHIGSGLPRATCPCGFCAKHRHGFERGDDLAAPQASAEDVRNAALVPHRQEWANRGDGYGHWVDVDEARFAVLAPECRRTLYLPQADKDGGQQHAGDVDERAAFEAWAYRAGMGPKFRESMFAAWEARAALSAPQAEQGERDA